MSDVIKGGSVTDWKKVDAALQEAPDELATYVRVLIAELAEANAALQAGTSTVESTEKDQGLFVSAYREHDQILSEFYVQLQADREVLQDSEQTHRSLFEDSSEGLVVIDPQTREVIICNWNYARLCSSAPGESATRVQALDFLHPGDSERVLERIVHEVLHERPGQPCEFQVLNRDATEIWISVSGANVHHGGEPAGLLAVRDITERKRAEEQVRIAEEKYRTIFENSAVAITVADGHERIVSWNKLAEALLGMDRDDLYMMPVRSLYSADDWRRIRSQNIRQKGMQHNLETRIVRKDRGPVDVELSVSVLKGPEGEVAGSIGIMTDITERKKAEEALRKSEERYRLLAENATDVISSTGPDLKPTYMSPSITRLLGYTPEEAMARTIDESLTPVSREVALKALAEQLSPDREARGTHPSLPGTELEFYRKDGSTVWVEVRVSFLRDSNGVPVGLVNLLRDVTERRKAEAERQRMEQQLQLSGRLAAVGQLSAGIAHELNNPLAAVQGYAEFLTSRADLEESVREDVETIHREARRATKITSNLLAFVRGHNGQRQFISVNKAVVASVELHAYRLRVNNIEIVTELEPGLPEAEADHHQLQQVFVNILTNAEQAMTEAHGKGRLLVKTQKAGNTIRISFADDGPGISPEDLANVFHPFFTTKDVGQGTGLGLSICYGIVEQHGGRMHAESELGHGATFLVELPIVSEDQAAEEQA